MSLGYAWEKLFNAVHGAIASEKPLQQRLADVCIHDVLYVHEEDVSPKIWNRVESFMATVTAKAPTGNQGSINATTAKMSDEEAGKLLQEVVSIFNEVAKDYYRSSPD